MAHSVISFTNSRSTIKKEKTVTAVALLRDLFKAAARRSGAALVRNNQ